MKKDSRSLFYRILSACTFFFCLTAESLLSEETEKPSLFLQEFQFQDDNGKEFLLSSLKGEVALVTMIYTKCKGACPITVGRIKGIDKALAKERKKDITYVLVSFDADYDKPEVLKEFRKNHSLDDRWILLTGEKANIRRLSVLLGISYQQDPDSKYFSHSNLLTLVNRKGEMVSSLEGLNTPYGEFVKRVLAER